MTMAITAENFIACDFATHQNVSQESITIHRFSLQLVYQDELFSRQERRDTRKKELFKRLFKGSRLEIFVELPCLFLSK